MEYIKSNSSQQLGKIKDFKGKTVSCNFYWNDNTSFVLDIGDGELFDKDGEPIFYHIEYNFDNGKWHFVFEIWWEENNAPVTDELDESEKCELKMLVRQLAMYQNVENIDYVLYINNDDKKLHYADLTDRESRTDNGDLWYKGAYGNCLIALYHARTTNKLYLVTKETLKAMNILVGDILGITQFLDNNADKIITR